MVELLSNALRLVALGATVVVAILIGRVAAQSGARPVAIHLEEGSVAGSQVVALGRDVVIDGTATAGVAAVGGSVRVSGSVDGDVVVLSGDVELAADVEIDGDVFVLGGRIVGAEGSNVTGRAVAYPTAPGALLVLAEGPALGLSPFAPVVLGGKLALLAAWLLTLAVLVATAAPAVRVTAESVRAEPLRNFFVGMVAVAALFLTGLFFTSFLGVVVGVPMVVLLAVVGLMLKLWGMVAVFARFGTALRRRSAPRVDLLGSAALALLILGFVKFLPWVGSIAWTAATLVGIGATIATKFGRQEPWFQ
ncbi:MAG: hypothetical protein VYE73_03750 [Acidobacteriota bacterium]|nr:hypothetical protein [Acidobacteriota bacterium]